MTRKRIGILGGNFNPVHHAHLMMADQVAQQLDLDKVYLMPEYIPPHIDMKETISAEHRLAMLELAVSQNPRLAIEPLEIDRQGISYTYDSIQILKAQNPDTDYFFIIGSDMVDYLPKWHKIDELIEKVTFVAVRRTTDVKATSYPIKWIDLPLMTLSSTAIRQMFAEGIEPKYLLPNSVIDYIKKNQLYD
ncbi:MAG: nicotinate-nucleotide adenylyltransferase [Streptococcaceae bacterium]|nr:nicotinate-nucleotide adenylyltransferase [Streptococcaceae bacterium]